MAPCFYLSCSSNIYLCAQICKKAERLLLLLSERSLWIIGGENASYRDTALTPFTVRSFFISVLSCVVSSTRTVSTP